MATTSEIKICFTIVFYIVKREFIGDKSSMNPVSVSYLSILTECRPASELSNIMFTTTTYDFVCKP